MAELTQNPKPLARNLIDLIKTPWALIVVILALVAILDPGNWTEVVSFAAKSDVPPRSRKVACLSIFSS